MAAIDRGFGGWRRAAPDVVADSGRPLRDGVLADASIVGVKLSELPLRRSRQWGACWWGACWWGACWLALMLWRELQRDRFWSRRLEVSRKEPALAKAGGRIGIRFCSCWSPTACWRLAANGACIVSGFSAAPWPTCWAKMPGWRKSTSFTAVTTGFWRQTSRLRSSGGAVARSVQYQLRRAALRPDEHPGLRVLSREIGAKGRGRWLDGPATDSFRVLLREAGVPTGLLCTPDAVRLVYAPAGETSGYITFRIADMAQIMGRPILGGFSLLLGKYRLFRVKSRERLTSLFAASRAAQNLVSTQLGASGARRLARANARVRCD